MNLAQRRAQHALECTNKLDKKDEEFTGCYRSYVERLGPAIIMNGLGQALASERSAAGPKPTKPGERAHQQLYENLQEWLCYKYKSEDDKVVTDLVMIC